MHDMVMVCKEINMFLSFLAGIDRDLLLCNLKKNSHLIFNFST